MKSQGTKPILLFCLLMDLLAVFGRVLSEQKRVVGLIEKELIWGLFG
jgi:hypothetical protein